MTASTGLLSSDLPHRLRDHTHTLLSVAHKGY